MDMLPLSPLPAAPNPMIVEFRGPKNVRTSGILIVRISEAPHFLSLTPATITSPPLREQLRTDGETCFQLVHSLTVKRSLCTARVLPCSFALPSIHSPYLESMKELCSWSGVSRSCESSSTQAHSFDGGVVPHSSLLRISAQACVSMIARNELFTSFERARTAIPAAFEVESLSLRCMYREPASRLPYPNLRSTSRRKGVFGARKELVCTQGGGGGDALRMLASCARRPLSLQNLCDTPKDVDYQEGEVMPA
ncbi:hypothetical protein SCHPADRAFT_947537 [Schizopora paradoxa]|uniref:Uncharacterized protein n=1 Tax=Schizopora paradoxa TaxID=27342 RepID=A0A0H2RIJ7_9AGAM|nr:hypothetical protein SCHPADRAFT_947537 [Schizopora paradoxa]